MKKLFFALCLCDYCSINAQCPPADLTELVSISEKVGSALKKNYWKDWESVPQTMLLITDNYEYVLNARTKDPSFFYGCDSIQFRPASFGKSFLATFHLIDQTPTIVVGTPANTGKSPEGWVVTLLHEHFHQLQFGKPDYFSAQKELGLAKGDQTGMWMLNHPYPYDSQAVISQIKQMSVNLLRIYDPQSNAVDILSVHKSFKKVLGEITGEEHYKYLNLQLWQEGFTRFIEIQLLTDWINNFDQIDQSVFTKGQLEKLLERYHSRIKNDLAAADLKGMKREYFYSMGAAEAMLITSTNPDWKEEYFENLYDTDHLFGVD